MDNPELKRLQLQMRREVAVQQREAALKDHALKMTKQDNRRLRIAVALLRNQAGRQR